MMAGASAVSVGTANMIEPSVSEKIVSDLEKYLADESYSSIHDLIGIAHR